MTQLQNIATCAVTAVPVFNLSKIGKLVNTQKKKNKYVDGKKVKINNSARDRCSICDKKDHEARTIYVCDICDAPICGPKKNTNCLELHNQISHP